jgi:hypothetical protein
MGCQRFFSGVEILFLSATFCLALWGPVYDGVTVWTIGASGLFFTTIVCSAIARRRSFGSSGFRYDNFWPAVIQVSFHGGWLGIVIIITGNCTGMTSESLSIAKGLSTIGFGIFQQSLFLGHFFHLWNDWIRNKTAAAIANSLCFGLAHLPDLGLAGFAFLGELYFSWLFCRVPNVWALGLAHGVMALFVIPLLLQAGIVRNTRIGPPALAAFAARISDADASGADRIGLCSKAIAMDQLGGSRVLHRVLRGKNTEQEIRESLQLFLTKEGHGLCVITEREFYRYLEASTREKLFIIEDRFIWRNARYSSADFDRGAILGVFRDRALLVSNRSLSQ